MLLMIEETLSGPIVFISYNSNLLVFLAVDFVKNHFEELNREKSVSYGQ